MTLDLQFDLILYSFLFGIFYRISYELFYKILFHKFKIIKVISSLIFCFFHVLLYYLVIQKIVNGILNPYALISFIIGFLFTAILFTKKKN